jgi:hypothetical protein
MVNWEWEIMPSNNQPNLYVASQEQATIAKQQHRQRNDQYFTSYAVLQKSYNDKNFFSAECKK